MLAPQSNMNKDVLLFAGFVAAGLTVALVYHGVLNTLGFTFPWNTFLFNPIGRYDDWFTSVAAAATHDPYLSKEGGAYFPFAYVALLVGVAKTKAASLTIYGSVSAILIGTGVFLFWKNCFSKAAAPYLDARQPAGNTLWTYLLLLLIVFLSYPFWFGSDRGNIDPWICGLCLIYVAELRSGRSWLGPVALGVAIAMKGYPLALILLGVRQRRYAETGFAVLLAMALTVLSLMQFRSGLLASWHGLQKGQNNFWLQGVIGSASMFGTTDPYNGLRTLAWIGLHAKQQLLGIAAPPEALNAAHFDPHLHAKFLKSISGGADLTGPRVLFAQAYGVVSTIFATVSAFYVLFIASSRWRQVTIVALVTILYPNIAGDYKLLILLIAIFNILADSENSKARRWAFWLMALMMIPKSYLFFYGLSISMILEPALLLCLWWVAISDIPAWKKGLAQFRTRLNWYIAGTSSEWERQT